MLPTLISVKNKKGELERDKGVRTETKEKRKA
jgi:hypothetical protein